MSKKAIKKETKKIVALFKEWDSRSSYTDDEIDLLDFYVEGRGLPWHLVMFYAGYKAGKKEAENGPGE